MVRSALRAGVLESGVLERERTLYSSLPSLPRVRTTVSCSLPTLKPSCLDAAAAGLAYWGNPYLNVTLLSLPALNSARVESGRVGKRWIAQLVATRFRSFAARASTTVTGRVPARNRAGELNGERTFHIHLGGYGRLYASGYLVVRLTAQRPGGEADVVPDGSGSGRDGQHISTELMRPGGSSRDEGGRG